MSKQLMLHDDDEDTETSQKFYEHRARLIYEAYPRRVAPVAARKAIVRVLKKKTIGHEELLAAVKRYAKDIEQELASGVLGSMYFVPHPTTWFNQGRWDDEPDPKARGQRLEAPDGKYGC